MTQIPQIQPITQQERTAFLERQQMIEKINEMIAKWNSMTAEWGLIGGNIDDQTDLKIKLDGINEDIADVDDRVDAVEDEIGAAGQAGTIRNDISLLQSGKADDSSVVKLSGAQTIDGRKSFSLAPVSQDIITGIITTDKWKKIIECAAQSREIDALIAVTLWWCKGDILHVRFSQTEGYNDIKKFIKGANPFAAGRFCTAFNSTTGAVELWTAESRCAAYVLYAAHVSQGQPLTLPLLYATPDSPEGDKPEVGETYTWVKDSPA